MLRKRNYGKKSSFKYKGKVVEFAELDGPFSSGMSRQGVEKGEYVIELQGKGGSELGALSFPSYKDALYKLNQMGSKGVEVSSMTSG